MKKVKAKPKAKESGHWKPALWATPKVRLYMRHVRREAISSVPNILTPGKCDDVFAALLDLFDAVTSRALINRRGYKTIGEVGNAQTVDGAVTRESVDPKQQAGSD